MRVEAVDVAVVGGGAAGLTAAVCAAREGGGRLRVAVLERQKRVGRKLIATGNGRCNITNLRACEALYGGSLARVASRLIREYPPRRALAFFESIGVCAREEDGGRAYPTSDQASSVLDALRLALCEAGGEEMCDFDVSQVAPGRGRFSLRSRDGRALSARAVILACGGPASPALGGTDAGYALAAALGHGLAEPLPALTQLTTERAPIRALKGIKFLGTATLMEGGEALQSVSDEILFTDYGLSGPAIMRLSRLAAELLARERPPELHISLAALPMGAKEALAALKKRRERFPERSLENFLTGMINKRLGQTLIKLAADRPLDAPCGALSEEELVRLAEVCAGWRLRVVGTQGFAQAQVTAGGVTGEGISPETLESRRAPGLYFAGEMMDVDGECGGYNLQWAWSSGMCAGENAAKALLGGRV